MPRFGAIENAKLSLRRFSRCWSCCLTLDQSCRGRMPGGSYAIAVTAIKRRPQTHSQSMAVIARRDHDATIAPHVLIVAVPSRRPARCARQSATEITCTTSNFRSRPANPDFSIEEDLGVDVRCVDGPWLVGPYVDHAAGNACEYQAQRHSWNYIL